MDRPELRQLDVTDARDHVLRQEFGVALSGPRTDTRPNMRDEPRLQVVAKTQVAWIGDDLRGNSDG